MARDKGKKTRRNISPEPEPEDWCFYCKDGGELVVCDHRNCGKVYHPDCVKKDQSFFDNVKSWFCGWHVCYNCNNRPKFYCISCPNAICQKCFPSLQFTLVRGARGLCVDCFNLVKIIEQNLEHDSEGNKITLDDNETYEALFKTYWENIIKAKEGLTTDEISAALPKPNHSKGKNPVLHTSCSGSKNVSMSKNNENNKDKQRPTKRKRCNSMELEERSKDKVNDRLESHFAKGFPDLAGHESHDQNRNDSMDRHINDQKCMESKKSKPPLKKRALLRKPTCFADITESNIKLIYLRQSFVVELLEKQPENFVSKVVGSFVRAKVYSNNHKPNWIYQLVRVLGVVNDDISHEILLQVSSTAEAMSFSKLSDIDFKPEECEDLRQKMETGLLPKLTVEEVQEKAEILHVDITKHWIPWRLRNLQHWIDYESCRGRTNKKLDLLNEREKLKKEEYVKDLLSHVPLVTPEFIESTDDDSDEDGS